MISIITYIAISIIAILLVRLEKKIHGNYYTPFVLFSIPYLFILLYQILCIEIYDLDKMSFLYLLIILIFMLNISILGIFYKSMIDKFKSRIPKKYSKVYYKDSVLEIISIISATYLLIYFLYSMMSLPNIGQIVQEDFQTRYSGGINFYLRLICMIGSVYFFSKASFKNIKQAFFGIYCLIPNILTFVKGIIFIICLGGVLGNIIFNNRKIKIKSILITVILGISIFFIVYIVEIGIWDIEKLFEKETYELIFNKLNVYIISGVQSFNVNLANNNELFKEISNPVYAPVLNIFSKFGIVERVDSINNIWANIGYIKNYGDVIVNTNTYIGTLFLYCGLFIGLIINSVIGLIMYIFYYSAITKNEIIYIARYSLLVTGFILSWFEYYYMHTFWIYLIILFYLFIKVSKFKSIKL